MGSKVVGVAYFSILVRDITRTVLGRRLVRMGIVHRS